jgi:hypothetical protein
LGHFVLNFLGFEIQISHFCDLVDIHIRHGGSISLGTLIHILPILVIFTRHVMALGAQMTDTRIEIFEI